MFQPIRANHYRLTHAAGPSVFNCIKLIFVREGSAQVFGEFKRFSVSSSDVALLGPNLLHGMVPDGFVSYSVVMLDVDFLIDQIFWRFSAYLSDRLDAAGFAGKLYPQLVQRLSLGGDTFDRLLALLDELVELSTPDRFAERFNRIQALWFAIADLLSPHVVTARPETFSGVQKHVRTAVPATRRFAPLRADVQAAAYLLRSEPARAWTLQELAAAVHLSKSQLQAVFAKEMGKTPIEYLRMVRVERMARYLRESDLSVETLARLVGWCSRAHAASMFRQLLGMSPSEYRRLRAHLLCPGSSSDGLDLSEFGDSPF